VAYLDAASAEPLHPAAREVLAAALDEGWADPARLYSAGRRARLLLDEARASVAAVVGAHPDEISFTASGTQALHLGVLGLLETAPRGRAVTSAVEHSAVLHALERHELRGGRVTRVAPDRAGRVDPRAFAAALAGDPAGTDDGDPAVLAALQHANHEVGTVQPLEDVAAACRADGVPLLVDAAQTLGRIPVPDGWSVLAASAHKWGGPPGVGVLAVRRRSSWRSPSPADEREHGRVPGAENVPAVIAAAAALEQVVAAGPAEDARLRGLVALVRSRVAAEVPDVEVVGDPDRRLPHVVTFSCLYLDGEALVSELDRAGFAVSSGSSCTSSTLTPSHVLEAMGVLTHGNVRVSLPRGVDESEVHRFLDLLPRLVADLRARAGVTGL
jgi:cysteine desulfurase